MKTQKQYKDSAHNFAFGFVGLIIILAFLLIGNIAEAKPKEHLPFANKAKYGKYRTKQCKPVKNKEAWIYRQWGRN